MVTQKGELPMFNEISVYSLNENPFDAINNQWMLITAGKEKVNTMTASWGGLGIMWNKEVATCFIRPQRYTFEFVENEEYFSLCFFGSGQREALKLCGTLSGRDCDKIAQAGLHVVKGELAPYFEEAETVLICRKIYKDRIKPEGFIDPSIEKNYANGDYHYVYMGEIVKCLKRV